MSKIFVNKPTVSFGVRVKVNVGLALEYSNAQNVQ